MLPPGDRVIAWFSCGDASAAAAYMAIAKYGDAVEVCYCDTLAYEHPDNRRFLADVEKWLGRPVTVLRSEELRDACDNRGWLPEPNVGRVANGVPSRSHRLKCLGNAVVPQIPEIIGRAIMSVHNQGEHP